ncbi:MAG: QueT transporter family protein [Candidatus Binataceae bacterium]
MSAHPADSAVTAAGPIVDLGISPPMPPHSGGHELRLMWRNTRMVVLCVLSASLYAAVLVPFKVVPLIPGVTELRPGNAIPVVCSMLFGPAAAWGSAIGNMIGDFFGGVGPGDVFGFFGNLAYGYIPYKVWSLLAAPGESAMHLTPRTIAKYIGACLSASMLCADIVGWGDNLLALRPFWLLGNVIIFNNMLAAIVLSPLLLAAVYPRVRAARLLYSDVMPEIRPRRKSLRLAGFAMLIGGEAGAWLTGNLIASGRWSPHFLPAAYALAPYSKAIAVVVSPLVIVAFAGMMLL